MSPGDVVVILVSMKPKLFVEAPAGGAVKEIRVESTDGALAVLG